MDGAMFLFTGRNGAAVKEWVNSLADVPAGESWFLTRGMAASTGNQAWNYVKAGRDWDTRVVAAVYDPRREWMPVRAGDVIVRDGPGFRVSGQGDTLPTGYDPDPPEIRAPVLDTAEHWTDRPDTEPLAPEVKVAVRAYARTGDPTHLDSTVFRAIRDHHATERENL